MRNIVAAAAAVAALLPASALADVVTERRFTRAGETYVYTQIVRDDGAAVLNGRRIGGGTFRLRVAGDRVSGSVDGRPVSFRIATNARSLPSWRRTETLLKTREESGFFAARLHQLELQDRHSRARGNP